MVSKNQILLVLYIVGLFQIGIGNASTVDTLVNREMEAETLNSLLARRPVAHQVEIELFEGKPLIRSERGGLLGLPLPTQALLTGLLVALNNAVSQLGLTVVILPSPLPLRLATCIPGCLQNPDCRAAIIGNGAGDEPQNPLNAVMGLLNLGL